MPADLEAILEKFADTIAKQQKSMEALMKKVDLHSNSVNRDSDSDGASSGNAAPANSQSIPRDTRKEHYLTLFQNLQKSTKLKDYKISSQENVREWLKRFDLCIENLSKACDIDPATLTRDEYINLIKSRLDLSVLCEMELKFKSLTTATTWENVTKKDLHKYLIEQFGSKEPDLSTLMKYFGANRPKKSPDTKVKNFFCKWWEELPLCLKPTTDAEREACVSLLQRTLFYHALDDTYLQQKIADIPEAEQTLKAFNEAAQKAESQRHQYRDAAEKSNVLDAASNVSINKCDPSQNQSAGRGGRNKSRWRGRGRGAAAGTTGGGDRAAAPGGGGETMANLVINTVPREAVIITKGAAMARNPIRKHIHVFIVVLRIILFTNVKSMKLQKRAHAKHLWMIWTKMTAILRKCKSLEIQQLLM